MRCTGEEDHNQSKDKVQNTKYKIEKFCEESITKWQIRSTDNLLLDTNSEIFLHSAKPLYNRVAFSIEKQFIFYFIIFA